LLISALTAAAGWWQTHVIAQQLSSGVWPYVTLSTTANSDGHIVVNVVNDGLGPAILDDFEILVDGKPQHDIVAVLHALAGHFERDHPDLSFGPIVPGEVLRANSSTLLFAMTSKRVVPNLVDQVAGRASVRLCYCSIVDNCWTVGIRSEGFTARPTPVARCPDADSDQLHAVTQAELKSVR